MASLSEAERIRQLAEQLLAHPHPYDQLRAQLIVGGLPDDLKVQLAMPAGGQLLGSAAQRRDGALMSVEAVIEVDRPLDVVLNDYQERLKSDGWHEPAAMGGPRGFVPGGFAWRSFQQGAEGPMLTLDPQTIDGRTQLRLRINYERPPQGIRPPRPPGPPPAMELMPILYPPTGVRVEPAGGGGSDSSWTSQTTAFGDMRLQQLHDDFSRQLLNAGWRQLTVASSPEAMCSLWALGNKEHWHGVLGVMESNQAGERTLFVHIQGPTSRFHGGGYAFSSTHARR